MSQRNVIVNILLVVGMAMLFNACVVAPNGAYYRSHVPPSTVYRSAPAYYEWYYFPDSGVYYNISERYYYYPYNGSWRRATQLPSRLVLRYEDRVRLKLTGTPYNKFEEHRRKYPPRHHERHDHDRDRHERKENHDTFKNRYELKEHSQPGVNDQKRERVRDHNRDRNTNINKDHKPSQDKNGGTNSNSTVQPRFRSRYERADKPHDNSTNHKKNTQPTSNDNKQKHKKKNKGRNTDKKKSDEKSKATDSQSDSNNTNNDADELDTSDKKRKSHRQQK